MSAEGEVPSIGIDSQPASSLPGSDRGADGGTAGSSAGTDELVVMSGVQLLLAEKRTSLSVTRTGIAVLALPLGVLSLLVATSRYYSVAEASGLFVALVFLCVGLVILGAYLVVHSLHRIRHIDVIVHELRRGHPRIEPFLD